MPTNWWDDLIGQGTPQVAPPWELRELPAIRNVRPEDLERNQQISLGKRLYEALLPSWQHYIRGRFRNESPSPVNRSVLGNPQEIAAMIAYLSAQDPRERLP